MESASNSTRVVFDHYEEPIYSINSGSGIMIGRTKKMRNLFLCLNKLASLPTTILLHGESGTGKELCAKALHYNGLGERKRNQFVAVNCAGIPSELLESELFGYKRGAFTGAHCDTQGKFQFASNGTILLDEIGDMSLHLQAKILRVLQEREVTPVGSTSTQEVNVRVIAATNRNLEELVKNGKFREDLYYRLNVIPITIPPLRERKEDVSLIAEHLLKKHKSGSYASSVSGFSQSALDKLRYYEWPGNVRELENVIERAVILAREGFIKEEDITFDSEMPLERLALSFARDTKQEAQGGAWYLNGILPISPFSLSKFDGSKSYPTIHARLKAKKPGVYFERLGRNGSLSLLYLTPDTAPLLFRDTETADYRVLLEKMEKDRFNEIAREPFKFFSVPELAEHESTLTAAGAIQRAAQECNAYQLTIRAKTVCYAITLNNAPYFASNTPDKQKNTFRLKREIAEHYSEFIMWRPSST